MEGSVDQLDLRPFLMMDHWKDPRVSLTLDGEFTGRTIDEMKRYTGDRQHTSLSDSNFIYNPGPIYLQALGDSGEGKNCRSTPPS